MKIIRKCYGAQMAAMEDLKEIIQSNKYYILNVKNFDKKDFLGKPKIPKQHDFDDIEENMVHS